MALHCPACARPGLRTGRVLELPADAESDEITIEVLRCADCGLVALGLDEESRRGSDDCWRHGGWRIEEGEAARADRLIASCPQPERRTCGCESHAALGAIKDGLRGRDDRFPVRVAPREAS